jgi:hypothetical protein
MALKVADEMIDTSAPESRAACTSMQSMSAETVSMWALLRRMRCSMGSNGG